VLSMSPAPLRRRARTRRLLEPRERPPHVTVVAAPARASARHPRGEILSARAPGAPVVRSHVELHAGREASRSSDAEAEAMMLTRPQSRGPRRLRWRPR
jgi:hypothetical protein